MSSTSLSLMKKWIKEVGDETLIVDDHGVYCSVCKKKVVSHKKFQIQQHLRTKTHRNSVGGGSSRSLNHHHTIEYTDFAFDLCETLVSANIPLSTLNNKTFRSFLEKYTERSIPNHSALREIYLNKSYEHEFKRLPVDSRDNYIWISIDEISETCHGYTANLFIGKISEYEDTRTYLLSSLKLERLDNVLIVRFVNSSLLKMWPTFEDTENVLLITDSAPYMEEAAGFLSTLYPNLKHVVCPASGMFRVAEKVRCLFPEVDDLINDEYDK